MELSPTAKGIAATAACIGLPLAHLMGMRILFDWSKGDLFILMSMGFLIGMPFVAGVLTTLLSPERWARSLIYQALMPVVPVVIFMIITLTLSLEGWACWIMAFPLFVVAAITGGVLGAWLQKRPNNRVQVSLVVLMPFLLASVEGWVGAKESIYTAENSIDIKAPASTIWANVTRVQAIPEEQDKGWLTRNLGFPRPVKAELDFAGLGGKREAIFTNGLVFHETVTAYEEQKKMVFTIKANPHEIPSTTLDEHIVIGGDYFDVIDGTYELEQLGPDLFRLHLYSHFKLTTTFNFYASYWATWIMQDIQQNILQIEKRRAEGI